MRVAGRQVRVDQGLIAGEQRAELQIADRVLVFSIVQRERTVILSALPRR